MYKEKNRNLKKKHNSEIRIYVFDVTDDTTVALRDKIKNLIMESRDLDGNRIKSSVTSFERGVRK